MCFEKENKRSLTRVQGYKKRSCQEAGGPNLTREDRVPWPYGGHHTAGTQGCQAPMLLTTHFRARLGLSGRIAVKSLHESDLCDRHPSRVLIPLFLQQAQGQKDGDCHDNSCQLHKGPPELLPPATPPFPGRPLKIL